MEYISIQQLNPEQPNAIKAFLDNMHLKYHFFDAAEMDETEYLMSSPTMAKHLDESIGQAKRGEITTISLDDIWK